MLCRCIDGFSRKIMWLQASYSNHNPGLITSYYLQTVSFADGHPTCVRTDCGTENATTATIQSLVTGSSSGHVYGTSPGNQRFETRWSFSPLLQPAVVRFVWKSDRIWCFSSWLCHGNWMCYAFVTWTWYRRTWTKFVDSWTVIEFVQVPVHDVRYFMKYRWRRTGVRRGRKTEKDTLLPGRILVFNMWRVTLLLCKLVTYVLCALRTH